MKKYILAALVGTIALNVSSAFAANAFDGTVNFTGKIVDSTCTVKTASKNLTVTLPTVAKQSFTTVGDTRGKTAFTIELENCPATVTGATPAPTKVYAYFHNDFAKIDAQGRIENKAASNQATNVKIQLRDAAGTVIDLSKDAQGQNQAGTTVGAGAIALRYYAEYIATGASVGSGDVQGSVDYTIAYQ